MHHSLTLLTDLYQLTMGYGYFRSGMSETPACFNLFFRKNPFKGGYAIAAGLEDALSYLGNLSFDSSDIEYLASLSNSDGSPLFERDFLDYLAAMECQLSVHAMPEGTVAFPHEPLLRVTGPLIQCQLVETALLNIVNFQTLIATKSARICMAAMGEDVLEFGLRRAQGVDGALSASRAAYIGGCAATSNVLAGKRYGIPVKGTHAHSWVMSFDTERTAFETYAAAMPKNCVFLVDTYDTLEGVRCAVEVGKRMRKDGHEMLGIRLDSGDLAELSKGARKILDEGGFPNAAIVASNDLDEYRITTLKEKGATITVWGVGTRLTTAYDQPALGGVYKLAAIQDDKGNWSPRIKLSEQPIKVSIPGFQQVRRYQDDHGKFVGDVIYQEGATLDVEKSIHPENGSSVPVATKHYEDILVEVLKKGVPVANPRDLSEVREYCLSQQKSLPGWITGFKGPARYPANLDPGLAELRNRLRTEKKRS